MCRSVRGRQLSGTLERREAYKLRVLRALREVDPGSFRALFSRADVPVRARDSVAGLLSVWVCMLERVRVSEKVLQPQHPETTGHRCRSVSFA